jgi:hypothetical protein
MNPQFIPIQLEPAEMPLDVISLLSVNPEILKGRGLLVMV